MNRILKTFSLGILALSLAVPAAAFGKGGGRDGHFKKMIEELNLTKEQKEQARKIHSDEKDGVRTKRKAMTAAHDELEKAIKGSATEQEIRSKFDALQKAQDEFSKARFEKILALRAILTPEQRAKMKSPRGMHRGGEGHGDDGDDD